MLSHLWQNHWTSSSFSKSVGLIDTHDLWYQISQPSQATPEYSTCSSHNPQGNTHAYLTRGPGLACTSLERRIVNSTSELVWFFWLEHSFRAFLMLRSRHFPVMGLLPRRVGRVTKNKKQQERDGQVKLGHDQLFPHRLHFQTHTPQNLTAPRKYWLRIKMYLSPFMILFYERKDYSW